MRRQLPLPMWLSFPHPCSYLDHQMARTLMVDGSVTQQSLYNQLAQEGFRRNGNMVYRPHCSQCQQCQSLRVDVARFQLSRNHQRALRRNRHLQLHRRPFDFYEDHYQLFLRYLIHRHEDGAMSQMSRLEYRDFLAATWSDTWLWEWRDADALRIVAVVDELKDGLSAVYTFFDPDFAADGLGNFAILQQIIAAQRRPLPWLYLGYWIRDSQKMAYKSRYHPHEVFIVNQGWRSPPTY